MMEKNKIHTRIDFQYIGDSYEYVGGEFYEGYTGSIAECKGGGSHTEYVDILSAQIDYLYVADLPADINANRAIIFMDTQGELTPAAREVQASGDSFRMLVPYISGNSVYLMAYALLYKTSLPEITIPMSVYIGSY